MDDCTVGKVEIVNGITGMCTRPEGIAYVDCPPGKILNDATGRCVHVHGRVGKEVLDRALAKRRKKQTKLGEGGANHGVYEPHLGRRLGRRLGFRRRRLGTWGGDGGVHSRRLLF